MIRKYRWKNLQNLLVLYLDMRGHYENAMTYPGSVSRRCPNIAKAVSNFAYKPEVFWRDAVVKTVDWYKTFLSLG